MNWNNHENDQAKYTSTPKRRRLGTSQILRQTFKNIHKSNVKSSANHEKPAKTNEELNEGEFLPCNQIEYLCDSDNNSSICSEILCSPEVLRSNISKDKGGNMVTQSSKCENERNSLVNTEIQQEIEDISDDMFYSKLELEGSQEVLPSQNTTFKDIIEESFAFINESLCDVRNKNTSDMSALFDTKDSFLLDIRETGILKQTKEHKSSENYELMRKNVENHEIHQKYSFYGLPLIAKGLFKTYKNIERFYEWQEECLNLDVIKQRRNLIYALPTSGGKTLVAEVLMLQEVTCRKKNALFILPFVAIVQEKIWSLSPFALQMDFLLEEYAAGKGHLPPKKRRRKNSIYIATIEKGLALVRSLIELDRLNEIGLIVVDELHLIGESGRGGTLETLLTTVIFANKGIQIIGMSATIGNLPSLAKFLRADIFERKFRPVELTEYVKLGDMLYKIQWVDGNMDVVPDRKVECEYTASESSLDPDRVCVLVNEVFPKACLVFCATKRNCENVATMLCKLSKPEMLNHRKKERDFLVKSLRAEGASSSLCNSVMYGVAYHHAGLSSDERNLLEHAYRCETINVLCCTSTLAAGVNLPAQRVVIRSPAQGRAFVTVANYRQMAGRAGRAGLCDQNGESIIICPARDWPRLRTELSNGVPPLKSVLIESNCMSGLVLSAIALKLANTRVDLKNLMACTFLAVCEESSTIKQARDDALRSLLKSGAIQLLRNATSNGDASHLEAGSLYIYNDTVLEVSTLGKAAIRGCMDLVVARQLVKDIELSSRGLVLAGSLHLLYLVTPHDAAGIRPDYRHYYSLYCNLDVEGIQTAKVLGITEMNAIRMMTGKPITNVSELVLSRFYLALMLHDLWKQVPFHIVADKYLVPRGTVQSLMTSAASFASCANKFCEMSDKLWPYAALFAQLAPRLQYCAAPGLDVLMELPNVKKARALQLLKAGFKTVEDIAKASTDDLVNKIDYLSRTAATQLVSAARMMLIEKVENLRAEAEEVMEGLKM